MSKFLLRILLIISLVKLSIYTPFSFEIKVAKAELVTVTVFGATAAMLYYKKIKDRTRKMEEEAENRDWYEVNTYQPLKKAARDLYHNKCGPLSRAITDLQKAVKSGNMGRRERANLHKAINISPYEMTLGGIGTQAEDLKKQENFRKHFGGYGDNKEYDTIHPMKYFDYDFLDTIDRTRFPKFDAKGKFKKGHIPPFTCPLEDTKDKKGKKKKVASSVVNFMLERLAMLRDLCYMESRRISEYASLILCAQKQNEALSNLRLKGKTEMINKLRELYYDTVDKVEGEKSNVLEDASNSQWVASILDAPSGDLGAAPYVTGKLKSGFNAMIDKIVEKGRTMKATFVLKEGETKEKFFRRMMVEAAQYARKENTTPELAFQKALEKNYLGMKYGAPAKAVANSAVDLVSQTMLLDNAWTKFPKFASGVAKFKGVGASVTKALVGKMVKGGANQAKVLGKLSSLGKVTGNISGGLTAFAIVESSGELMTELATMGWDKRYLNQWITATFLREKTKDNMRLAKRTIDGLRKKLERHTPYMDVGGRRISVIGDRRKNFKSDMRGGERNINYRNYDLTKPCDITYRAMAAQSVAIQQKILNARGKPCPPTKVDQYQRNIIDIIDLSLNKKLIKDTFNKISKHAAELAALDGKNDKKSVDKRYKHLKKLANAIDDYKKTEGSSTYEIDKILEGAFGGDRQKVYKHLEQGINNAKTGKDLKKWLDLSSKYSQLLKYASDKDEKGKLKGWKERQKIIPLQYRVGSESGENLERLKKDTLTYQGQLAETALKKMRSMRIYELSEMGKWKPKGGPRQTVIGQLKIVKHLAGKMYEIGKTEKTKKALKFYTKALKTYRSAVKHQDIVSMARGIRKPTRLEKLLAAENRDHPFVKDFKGGFSRDVAAKVRAGKKMDFTPLENQYKEFQDHLTKLRKKAEYNKKISDMVRDVRREDDIRYRINKGKISKNDGQAALTMFKRQEAAKGTVTGLQRQQGRIIEKMQKMDQRSKAFKELEVELFKLGDQIEKKQGFVDGFVYERKMAALDHFKKELDRELKVSKLRAQNQSYSDQINAYERVMLHHQQKIPLKESEDEMKELTKAYERHETIRRHEEQLNAGSHTTEVYMTHF